MERYEGSALPTLFFFIPKSLNISMYSQSRGKAKIELNFVRIIAQTTYASGSSRNWYNRSHHFKQLHYGKNPPVLCYIFATTFPQKRPLSLLLCGSLTHTYDLGHRFVCASPYMYVWIRLAFKNTLNTLNISQILN